MTESTRPAISVIICTYGPDRPILDWVLEGLAAQTAGTGRFEVVLVDNGSDPPVEIRDAKGLSLRIVREPANGLSHARSRGIAESCAPYIVFVDDDNRLDTDYLQNVLEIVQREPGIGAFSGIARPLFERSPQSWKLPLLCALGIRDCGTQPLTEASEEWGNWLPIGAGLVCRRDVALRYRQLVRENHLARILGRTASSWISGDDTLLARMAIRCGYACSYQPALRLEHYVRARRLRAANLARTMYGHGRAYAILEHLRSRPSPGLSRRIPGLMIALGQRVRAGGLSGVFHWLWDCGVVSQSWRLRGDSSPAASLAHRARGSGAW